MTPCSQLNQPGPATYCLVHTKRIIFRTFRTIMKTWFFLWQSGLYLIHVSCKTAYSAARNICSRPFFSQKLSIAFTIAIHFSKCKTQRFGFNFKSSCKLSYCASKSINIILFTESVLPAQITVEKSSTVALFVEMQAKRQTQHGTKTQQQTYINNTNHKATLLKTDWMCIQIQEQDNHQNHSIF